MKKLLELISRDNEFADSIEKAGSISQVIALVAEKDIELRDADVRIATRTRASLDDPDPDEVAGGSRFACVIGGGGKEDGAEISSAPASCSVQATS